MGREAFFQGLEKEGLPNKTIATKKLLLSFLININLIAGFS